jgi:hypothetical protein
MNCLKQDHRGFKDRTRGMRGPMVEVAIAVARAVVTGRCFEKAEAAARWLTISTTTRQNSILSYNPEGRRSAGHP